MTALCDFSSPERLTELLNFLTDGGRLNDRFENFALQNILARIRTGGYPKGHIRVLGYPSTSPHYVFMIEDGQNQFRYIQVRTPSDGHDSVLLSASLRAVLDLITPDLTSHGQLLLESDTTVRAMFFELQNEGNADFEMTETAEYFGFFMDDDQKRRICEIEYSAPEDYRIDSIDLARDFDQMMDVWRYRDTAPHELVRLRVQHLPSVCLRADDGRIAAWETGHAFGQLTHLYTLSPHRGKGLGLLAENLLAQMCARQGQHVFKFVAEKNANVLKGTHKHPFWTPWNSVRGSGESDVVWSFSCFKCRSTAEH